MQSPFATCLRLALPLVVLFCSAGCGGGGGGGGGPTPAILVTPLNGLVTSEAGGTATFSVVLASAPTADVSLAVATSNSDEGTVAVASLTFTPANWSVPQDVVVTGADDRFDDGDRAYSVVTSPAVSADSGYSGLDAGDAVLTNSDDDVAGIRVTPTSGLFTSESGGIATFTVALTSQPTAPVSIAVTSSNLEEGSVSVGSLQFAADTSALVPQTVTVTGVDDPDDDGAIAYTVLLAAAASADPGYGGRDVDDVAVTNNDDDTAGLTVNPTVGLVTTESGTPATFTVVLNTAPAQAVTVTLTSSEPAEATVSPTLLTFDSGNWNTPVTVTVAGVDDLVDDGDQPFTIVTSPTASADPNYDNLPVPDVTGQNLNDDTAGFTVLPLTPPALVTTENGGVASFTVQANSVPAQPVEVAVVSSDTSEGTVSVALLTFAADLTALDPQTVVVTGADDLLQDGNITFTIQLGPATSGDLKYSGVTPAAVAMRNLDDDSPGVIVTPVSGLITTEAGAADTFTVVLLSVPSADVTLALSSSDTSEGTVAPTTLTFTPANALTPQTVTVSGVDDPDLDGSVVFTIVLGTTSSTDPTYDGIDPDDVGCTNMDNEDSPPGSSGWSKQATPNAVLSPGTGSAWDAGGVEAPCVVDTGAQLVMFYQGVNTAGQKRERIGRAVSTDSVNWTKTPAPVLNHSGVNQTFDRTGVLAPTVLFDGATWRMWFGGASRLKIGLATSADGIVWTRHPGNPVLEGTNGTFDSNGTSSPTVVFDGAAYQMLYAGTDAAGVNRIGHATSADGVTWVKTVAPVLAGAAGAFDAAGASTPCVLQDGGVARMWYAGQGTGGTQLRIGYAQSTDGSTWTRFSGNPVLVPGVAAAFDSLSVFAPGVILRGAQFEMWYAAQDAAGVKRIGYARNPP